MDIEEKIIQLSLPLGYEVVAYTEYEYFYVLEIEDENGETPVSRPLAIDKETGKTFSFDPNRFSKELLKNPKRVVID